MTSPCTIRPGDGPYPAALSRLADRLPALRVRGALGEGLRRVAIVGSRATDEYGEWMAHGLAAGLARAGLSVVSGGALGVDAAAHRGALSAGGHTVVVLGGGVDVPSPARNRPLFDDILAAGGALLSEHADGTQPWRASFPARNRIISALSDAVVVVRAGPESGALITADFARQQRVPLLAVPGDVRDELSAGPHALLRAGARPVTCPADVLAELGIAARPAAPVQRELPALGLSDAALFRALGRRPRHADDLAREAGLAPGAALAGLLSLELEGLCEQRPGHYFLRRTEEGI